MNQSKRQPEQRLAAARAMFWEVADHFGRSLSTDWHLVWNSFEVWAQPSPSLSLSVAIGFGVHPSERPDAPVRARAEVQFFPVDGSRVQAPRNLTGALVARGYRRSGSGGLRANLSKELRRGARAVQQEKVWIERLLGLDLSHPATVPRGPSAAHAQEVFRRSPAWRPRAAGYGLQRGFTVAGHEGGNVHLMLHLVPWLAKSAPITPRSSATIWMPELEEAEVRRLRRHGCYSAVRRQLEAAGYRGRWSPGPNGQPFGDFWGPRMKTPQDAFAEERRLQRICTPLLNLLEKACIRGARP